ncbi:MAG: Ldh family oxidoreductase, partial [Betaproteobacteria bacterium]|nr:Ldh family oxidoreductase [Betaproteobacteria bacterium]
MQISIEEARSLLERVMQRQGYTADEAVIIVDHLMDAELRGLRQGGLARAISISERLARTGLTRSPMRIEHETSLSARLDGADQVGYLVGRRATEIALDKVKAHGISIVAAHNTWYTGMLSYYAEMAVAAGMVCMIASNATAWVAPHGATEGRFGTNPMCFAFPSQGTPVIWDIGTSIIIHADAMLARRLGQSLAPGVAFNAQGNPTTDPNEALSGALMPWGGAKGAGLGLVVQLLGIMAGSTVIPQDLSRFGFLIVMVDPGLLSPGVDFQAQVSEYVKWVQSAHPIDPQQPVRVPF